MRVLFVFSFCIFNTFAFSQTANQQNGYVKIYYPNGSISSEGIMINGKPDGYWKTYFANGVIKSQGNRRNHLLDSVWVFFNEVGDTLEKINFVLTKKNGFYYRYSSVDQLNTNRRNVIISKELYVNDLKEGLSYYYYPDGYIHETIPYRNNKKHGLGKEYDKNGVIITTYDFFNNYITDKQTINRVFNGFKHGIWKEFYDNGAVKTEKEYNSDQLTGFAKEFDKQGNTTLNLLYRNGKLIDIPKSDSLGIDEKIEYYSSGKVAKRGFYRKGIPIGIHREYDENEKVINSFIYNELGSIVSKGIINDDGSREGNWTYFFDEGIKKSEGVFVNNRQNGQWKFFTKNGVNEQVGSFKNGVLDGEWNWYYENGNPLRTEFFINGRKDGKFVEFSLSADTIEVGWYFEGEKNGFWKTISGDNIEYGNYLNGLKDGIWKQYFTNGILSYQGNFIQGNADGKHLFFFEDGRVREEQFYVNGIKEKIWRKYSTEGAVLITVTYESDTETRVNGFKLEVLKKN